MSLRVIYLIDHVFTDRDFSRFGFDSLIKNGVRVECWDFTCPQKKYLLTNLFDLVGTKHVDFIVFDEFKKPEKYAYRLPNAFVFDHRAKKDDSEYTEEWFKKNGAILVHSFQGQLPLDKYRQTIKDRYSLSNRSIKTICLKIIRKCVKSLRREMSEGCLYDIAICGGECDCSHAKLCIHSHSRDYDLYLNAGESFFDYKYVVFLDNGVFSHPDYKIHNISPHSTAQSYCRSINNLFDRLECELGLKVIISAHPSSSLDELKEYYSRYQVVQNSTPELVRDSALVIAHDSTAISFAVLWKKPLLIITTDDLEQNNYLSMQAMSSELSVKRINIDHLTEFYDWNTLSKVAIDQYDIYRNKYIKKDGTPEKNSWEIFIDKIKKYKY